MSFLRRKPEYRLGFLLFAGLFIIGAATTVAVVAIELNSYRLTTNKENLQLATALAAGSSSSLGQSSEKQTAQLEGLLQHSEDVRELRLLSKLPQGYVELAGASTGSGQVAPGTRVKGLTYEATDAFHRASATVSDELSHDDFGPLFVVYAPVTDENGAVAAVLEVKRDARPMIDHTVQLKETTWYGLGIVTLLAVLFSFTMTHHLSKSGFAAPWLRSLVRQTKFVRTTILEMILVGLAACILTVGLYGFLSQDRAQFALESSRIRSDEMETLRERLEQYALGERTLTSSDAIEYRHTAQALGLTSLQADLASEFTRENQIRSLRDIDAALLRERATRELFQSEFDTRSEGLTVTFCVGSLLALGSLALVRAAASQQHELNRAQLESERHLGAYRQVAESLPIGLFTFVGGALQYTNGQWDIQTGRELGEDRMAALMRSVHPDDLARVLAALEMCTENPQAFELQYRSIEGGRVHHLQLRAVPILDPDGQFEHMLGFAVDVTETVESQDQLESMNREVLASNGQLRKALEDLERNFQAMVAGLVKAVEAKDPYTAGHSERVMGYCVRIGKAMGLDDRQLRILERGALLHDVGKIGIPDAILTKPGALTPEEFDIVKQHPVIGYRMIQGMPMFQECTPIVLWHHERLDGTGYPDQLNGDHLPVTVRIAAVADCFDAMTSTRAYRFGMPPEKALRILREDAETGKLDAEIVEVLARNVEAEGLLINEEPMREAA